jgi:hypothetical protein
MDRQSASEISTALPRLPVMMIGSCDDAASSISRKSLDLASVAVTSYWKWPSQLLKLRKKLGRGVFGLDFYHSR